MTEEAQTKPPKAWQPGDLCEAKYRAQQVGSHNALWFAGRVEAVSSDGKRYDIQFDDGDREARVPRKYVRVRSAARAAAAGVNAAHQQRAAAPPTPRKEEKEEAVVAASPPAHRDETEKAT